MNRLENNFLNDITLSVSENESFDMSIDEIVKVSESMDYNDLRNKPTLDGQIIEGNIRERDPTVPDWAKSQTRPVYNAEDVGAVGKEELQEITIQKLSEMWDSI